jgi:hypothetical protein
MLRLNTKRERKEKRLKTRTMNDLHVDDELVAMISNDQGTNTAATRLEGFSETGPEVGLIDDGKGLLDIAGLGHCNNHAVLEIENTVLLEDRAQHCLNDNAGAWVGDEWRLFMQLLGEEVNAQVSVLSSGRWGCDFDDLARTTLKDQEIAETDVVGGDGDGVGGGGSFDRGTARSFGASTIFIVVTHLGRVTRRIDGLFGGTVFLSCGLEARRVNGRSADTNFFAYCLLESRRVNGGSADTYFFTEGRCRWLWARRIDGSSILRGGVAWLELGSVLTLSYVKLSVVMSAAVELDVNFRTVTSSVRKIDFDVCLFVFCRSALFSHVNILSAARTVAILFTSDMDLFLTELAFASGGKIGGERRVLFLPSDALLCVW